MNARVGNLAPVVQLPTSHGDFELELLDAGTQGDSPHVVLSRRLDTRLPPLVRIHSECLTGDVLGSQRCDCGPQLAVAMRRLSNDAHSYLFYLRQEGRGIGLTAKMAAYALQEQGVDTVQANLMLSLPADARSYGFVGGFLAQREVHEVRLLTNNPDKCKQLESAGIRVHRIPLITGRTAANEGYLRTKREQFGHYLEETKNAT